MDDAAECFENILHRLHCHIANTESEDTCAAKHCIPHQKFASHILEQVLCKCKATGEPKSYYQFVHYVSASALSENFQKDVSNPNVLVDLLKSSIQSGEMKACPDLKRCSYRSSGKNTTLTKTTLINCPDVLTVGVIWDTDSPSSSYILDVFDCFQNSLYFKNIFDNIPDHQCKHLELKVVGVVCYYGKHYTSFFYNSTEKQWIYFDDAHVKKIGHSWTSVIEKCYRNRFQPLLVIYANFNGSPVDVSNAPTSINIVSKEMLLSKPKSPPHRKHKRKTKRSKDSKPNDHESSRSKSLSVNKTCQNSSNDFSLVLPDSSLKENQEIESSRSNKANEGINPAYRSDVSLPGSNVQKVNTRPLPIIEKSMGIVDRRSENIDQTNVLENSQKNSYIRKKFVDIKNVISPKKQNLKKELLPNTSLRSNSLDSIFQNETNGDSSIFKSQYITPTVLNDNILQKQKAKLVVHQKTLSSLESKMNRSSSIDVLDSAHNQQKNSSDKKSSTRPNPNKTINSAEVLESCHHQKQKNTVDVPNSTASKKNLTSSFSSIEVSESHNYKNPLDARNSIGSKNPLDARNSIGSKNPLDARNSIGSKSNGTSSISSTELMNYKLYDNEDDLIDLPNNTQALLNNSFTNNDGRSSDRKAVQFDFLINHAEKMLRKSLHYEESGDLLLALRHCTDATRLFRDASKLVDNDSNLVEVVDKKRWSSFSRSEMLQKKIDNYLKLDGLPLEDKTLFDASFNQQNVRNSSRNSSFYNTTCNNFQTNNTSLHGCNENILKTNQTNQYVGDAYDNQSCSVGLLNTQNRLPSHTFFGIKGLPVPKQSLSTEEKGEQIDHTKLTFGKTVYSVDLIKGLKNNNYNMEELSDTDNKTISTEIKENGFKNLSVSDTRKKLKDNKRYHCEHCGWRKVDKRGDYCAKCKSDFI